MFDAIASPCLVPGRSCETGKPLAPDGSTTVWKVAMAARDRWNLVQPDRQNHWSPNIAISRIVDFKGPGAPGGGRLRDTLEQGDGD